MSESRLIFGTASVGSRTSYSEFSKSALLACSLGVKVFDTAPIYGRGLAQKYLSKFIAENPDLGIKVITKVGRVIKFDLKTLMVYLLRLDFSPIASGLVCLRGTDFSLSNENISRTKKEIYKRFDSGRVLNILVHSPDRNIINAEVLSELDETFKFNLPVGCSDPEMNHFKQFHAHCNTNFMVQVGYEEFLKRPDLQAHSGHLVVNGILRFSKHYGIPLQDLFHKIDRMRGGKQTSFNFGFYSREVVSDIFSAYGDYSA